MGWEQFVYTMGIALLVVAVFVAVDEKIRYIPMNIMARTKEYTTSN